MATFKYDCRNRLIEVTTDSGDTTKYAYDAENVRTKVIKNAGTQKESITTYVTDSVSNELSRVLEATTTDKEGNSETILYTYGNGLVAQEKGKEYLLYHFNHLGTTTAVTDEVGEVKYTYTYNIFGKILSGNYGEVEFMYNGQYGVASDANGLYYMRARYYNIDIMRFINQDILTGSIDSSQSLNRYAYVEDNPVSYLDPFGLAPTDDDDSLDYIEVLIGLVIKYLGADLGTASAGFVASVSPGLVGVDMQIGGSIDSDGDFVLQITFAGKIVAGAGGSAGGYYSKTNAGDVDDLEGSSFLAGITADCGIGLGIDFSRMSVEEQKYYGITVAVLGGASAEIHAGKAYTDNLVKGNIYEIYRKYLKRHMDN